MEEEYDYVELHVSNVRKIESDKRRCVVSLQRKGDIREFVFFTDEHNAARIALRSFPERNPMANVVLWSEFTVNALGTFDISIRNVTIIRGRDEIFRSVITMYNSDTGLEVNVPASLPDGVLLAISSNIPVKMERKLFEDASSINNDENRIRVPLNLLPRKVVESRLAKAVEEENYEMASLLRDELIRRGAQE